MGSGAAEAVDGLVGVRDDDQGQADVVEPAEDVQVGGGAVLCLVDNQFGVLGGQQRAERGCAGLEIAAGVRAQFGAGKVTGLFQAGAGAAGEPVPAAWYLAPPGGPDRAYGPAVRVGVVAEVGVGEVVVRLTGDKLSGLIRCVPPGFQPPPDAVRRKERADQMQPQEGIQGPDEVRVVGQIEPAAAMQRRWTSAAATRVNAVMARPCRTGTARLRWRSTITRVLPEPGRRSRRTAGRRR